MLTVLRTLVLGAAIAASLASQAETISIQCIPVDHFEGRLTIHAMCDATAVNAANGIKANEEGCAFPGQSIVKGEVVRTVYEQAAWTVVGTKEVQDEAKLRPCRDDEALSVITE